jgi:branched-chain amino acid transport system substrate-binding protein
VPLRRALPLLLAAALLAGAAARQEVRVGLILTRTGPAGPMGLEVERGARLALADRVRAGGQARRAIELVPGDTDGSPEQAAEAFEQLVGGAHVQAVLGELLSSRSLAMAPVADERRVPMVSPTATNPLVTQGRWGARPYVFGGCVVDPRQGTAMARFAREHLGLWRVAILADDGSEYARLLSEAFRAEWRRLGGTVTLEQAYRAGQEDLADALAPLKGPAAEAIYVPGYAPDAARIARAARAMGLTQVLLGGDGWDSPRLLDLGGRAVEGAYFTNHFAADDPDPRVRAFVRGYRAAYGEPPGALAALGHDAAGLLFDAVDRAEAPTGPAIRDALEATRRFPAVTGDTALDDRHGADRRLVVVRVERKGPRFVARVPAGAPAAPPGE